MFQNELQGTERMVDIVKNNINQDWENNQKQQNLRLERDVKRTQERIRNKRENNFRNQG